MSVQRFNSLAELIAHMSPLELKLYDEFGEEDYLDLMAMWASIEEDTFDEWYENTDPEQVEYLSELSNQASKITKMYDARKMLH